MLSTQILNNIRSFTKAHAGSAQRSGWVYAYYRLKYGDDLTAGLTCTTILQLNSWRKCRRKFQTIFPGSAVPSKATIYRTLSKIRAMGSVLRQKENHGKHVYKPRKTFMVLVIDWNLSRLRRLALKSGTSGSTVHVTTKCLKLRPYKTTVVHGLLSQYCEARIRYCRKSQESLFTYLLDP
jgi:hypothetical protein